ncbi:hypothetical protein [Brevibacillus sp. NRS-1366]|uniref:hypothetical protein n=1 Tax=Brevibacillus sp. NRS-1366 TaxID=3233899 RepID=UPI003D19557F
MNKEIIKIISTHNLIISESDNNDTLDAKFIICDFCPNKNDVMLNRDTIDTWIDTLQIKPLVGKVITKSNGTQDFSGHNVKLVKKVDDDGNEYTDIEFDTSAFGSFYSSSIETMDEHEYIVASAKIWKRFSQAHDVIKRRIDSKKGIKTSWEIQVIESHYETINNKQIKVIDKGVFIGHALLGENVDPAYDSSGILQVASVEEVDTELAEALANDIKKAEREDEAKMPKSQTDTSALTTRDLHQKVYEALNPKGWNSNPYYSVWEIYPEEHKVLAYDIDRTSEDEYMVFTYSVNEDVISVGEGTVTKLSNILAEKKLVDDQEFSKILSEKDEALVSASEKVKDLQAQVDELTPYKERVESLEQAERDQKHAEKMEDLKEIAMKGGLISKQELDTSEEIKSMIEALDEKGIKAVIAERFIKRLEENSPTVVTSEKQNKNNVKTNINTDMDLIDYKVVMSSFLNNN